MIILKKYSFLLVIFCWLLVGKDCFAGKETKYLLGEKSKGVTLFNNTPFDLTFSYFDSEYSKTKTIIKSGEIGKVFECKQFILSIDDMSKKTGFHAQFKIVYKFMRELVIKNSISKYDLAVLFTIKDCNKCNIFFIDFNGYKICICDSLDLDFGVAKKVKKIINPEIQEKPEIQKKKELTSEIDLEEYNL